MKFLRTAIDGVVVIELEPHADERGHFARTYCAREFAEHGLDPAVAQQNVSFNRRRGTLRGMHFQAPPHGEAKVVSCMRGAIYDVVVDVREGSPTFGRWLSFELAEGEPRSLYIAAGLAHGFQTLRDDCLVHYQMSTFYRPDGARGVRHDDPFFAIAWPLPVAVISERDLAYPLWPATS
ncbi:MAG TPA: dTDP-4-dehydrorhamnose 3,5-epimerase [Polyangiaceae bacterium]|nr:dTDP-4-dehydrorhamnose 3,5-epimerase [Polyangiaceae bacterium]